MIQARLIREKTAQLDLEVEESRKVPVSFDFLTIFKHLYCKAKKRQKIQPGKIFSSFPTFCAGKTYHGAKIFGQGPPSLILGIVHFLLMRWSSSYSWSSSSLVAIEQIIPDCLWRELVTGLGLLHGTRTIPAVLLQANHTFYYCNCDRGRFLNKSTEVTMISVTIFAP